MQGSTPGVEIILATKEEIQEQCIHVWRDQSEENGVITQECIRCKKSREITGL